MNITNIRYDKSGNLFFIKTDVKTFRTYSYNSLWYLEEMEPPCNDFKFINTFSTLEQVLEFLLMEDDKNE